MSVPKDDFLSNVYRQFFQIQNVHVNNLIKSAKRDYFLSKIKDCKSSKALFAITGQISGRIKPKVFPKNISKCDQPDKFCSFFKGKVEGIRNELSSCTNEPKFESFSGVIFDEFENVSHEFVRDIIMSSAPKSCMLDPIPTNLLQTHIDDLIMYISAIVNASLCQGKCPSACKSAVIQPLIKKHNLNEDELKNYRPVSNL